MPVLLQFAKDDGPVNLYDIWFQPIRQTLDLIEDFVTHTVVAFNLSFDWFQLCKLYTVFRLCPPDWIPIKHINQIALREDEAKDGPCLKPAGALDLLLHSRKGPYQSLMDRKAIRIRRVPTVLAYALRDELEARVKIDHIYFAKAIAKDAPKWKVLDVKAKGGGIRSDVKDVVLTFHPAGGLKFLAEHALKLTPKYHYADVEPPKAWYPIEYGYAPTARAVSSPERNWEVWQRNKKKDVDELVGHAWPACIERFIEHWGTHAPAREYASDDVVYLQKLDQHFGYPEPNDDDSVLAAMVGAIRWHGFEIDRGRLKKLLAEAQTTIDNAPINTNRSVEIRDYLRPYLNDTEAIRLDGSTNKKSLKFYSDLTIGEEPICTNCFGEGCTRCGGQGKVAAGPHPVAVKAKEVTDIKKAKKLKENCIKLLRAGRFHADFTIIGTRSSRMAGTGGLNAQGMQSGDDFRSCFLLAWLNMILCGGDFDSFEVTLAEAVYKDPALRKTLTTWVDCHKCSASGKAKNKKTGELERCDECESNGRITKKIHAAFAEQLFKGKTYEEIMASKEMYGTGKAAIFAMIYGGDWNTLVRNNNVEPELAQAAYDGFMKQYPGIEAAREITKLKFCSMRQPGGIGTQVFWHEPADFVESFLGFRRYFTLENEICRVLFDLAAKPPVGWRAVKIPVQRSVNGRVQTAGGAVSSAIYGAAFNIQSGNMRAAANHEIQSPGGQITKHVQRMIWDLQPAGVHEFVVAPINVHDEIMCVTKPDHVAPVRETVRRGVEMYRPQVPLIGMTWFEGMPDWSGKKSAGDPVKIRCKEMLEVQYD